MLLAVMTSARSSLAVGSHSENLLKESLRQPMHDTAENVRCIRTVDM